MPNIALQPSYAITQAEAQQEKGKIVRSADCLLFLNQLQCNCDLLNRYESCVCVSDNAILLNSGPTNWLFGALKTTKMALLFSVLCSTWKLTKMNYENTYFPLQTGPKSWFSVCPRGFIRTLTIPKARGRRAISSRLTPYASLLFCSPVLVAPPCLKTPCKPCYDKHDICVISPECCLCWAVLA